MTAFEATLFLRRKFPNVPQRTLARDLDRCDPAHAIFGEAFSVLPSSEREEVQDAVFDAAMGGVDEPLPGWSTIYSRIRRADAKLKAEAPDPIPA